MRLLADAKLARGRREVGRAGVVHGQVGRHFLGDVAIGKDAPDREAVAEPVETCGAAWVQFLEIRNMICQLMAWRFPEE